MPQVAESWSLDGSTWTFKIRDDLYFHNGDKLTAHDVKFSVDRFGDMSLSTNPWSWYISELYNKADSIVVDDYTYQFVSARPEPAQAVVFAWTRILPKDYYEELGMEEYRLQPMGSGPWKFVEKIPETSWKVEANTEYWGDVPKFQYIEVFQVPEEATRVAMFKRGEIDLCLGLTYDRLIELMDEGYRTISIGFPGVANFNIQGSWMPEAGPMHDIRVRQALSYSLNRQEICDEWYQGFAKPGGHWFMYPGSYGWSDALEADPYDLDKAKALLADAGYPDAWEDPTIHIYTSAAGQDYILMLMGYWQEAGLQVEMEIVDSTVFGGYFFSFARLQPGDPNVGWIFFWGFGGYYNTTYHAANMFTSVGTHNTANDPVADYLYEQATTELDPVKAAEYYTAFCAHARTLYVDIGIAQIETMMVYGPELGEWADRLWMAGWQDCVSYVTHP